MAVAEDLSQAPAADLPEDVVCRVRDLRIRFRTDEGIVTAVDGVEFDVKRGKTLGIVGESGSGKSVSTKAMMQLLPGNAIVEPSSQILVRKGDGTIVDVAKLSPNDPAARSLRGGDIAMIFQEPMASFSPVYSIGNQMMEAIRQHRTLSPVHTLGTQMTDAIQGVEKMGKKEAKEIAIDMLERVGLSNAKMRVDQYPHELSGGMRQRAMIALALSTRPALLIADEPTTALDVTIQAQILELMAELQDELGMSMIFITHDMGVIAQVADEVAVMYLGRIAERGKTDQVVFDPKHPYARGLIDAIPKLNHLDERLRPVPGDIPSPLERPIGCPFHTRCTERMPGRCDAALPGYTVVGPDHTVSCYLYE
ncbi:MAG: ABC transporter ATP-binding protein [Pseudomonadota bacterium]